MIFPNFVLFLILKPILFSSKASNYETIVSMETELDERTNSFLKVTGTDSVDGVRIAPKTTNNITQNSDNYQEAESGNLTQDLPLNDFYERNNHSIILGIRIIIFIIFALILMANFL